MSTRKIRAWGGAAGWRWWLVLPLLCAGFHARALQTVTGADARVVAERWLAAQVGRQGSWDGQAQPTLGVAKPVYAENGRGRLLAYVFDVSPAGYILVSAARELPPVKSFSTTDSFRLAATTGETFEAFVLQSLAAALAAVDGASPIRGTSLDTTANQQAWSGFLAPAARGSSYTGVPGLQFAVRDAIFDDATYAGGYDQPLVWGQYPPYNAKCPRVRTTPEEMWVDRDGSGTYSQTSGNEDYMLYDADHTWNTKTKTIGSIDGIYYYDQSGDGRYTYVADPDTKTVLYGENIWKDERGGVTGRYDQGIDTRVYPPAGVAGWVTPDGASGAQADIYYNDDDGSGDYTFTSGMTFPGSTVVGMASLMRYYEWPDIGIGSHTYNWAYHEAGADPLLTVPLTANFDHTYSWARMPLHGLGGATQAEQDNVAQLIYDVAVCFEVDFQRETPILGIGQGALDRFAQHFRFNRRSIEYVKRTDMPTDAAWFSRLQGELDAHRPVLLRAFQNAGLFTSVLVDGYDKTAGVANLYLLHCNIGGGRYWYALDNILGLPYFDPGTAMNEVISQDAVLNVLPLRTRPVLLVELFQNAGNAAGDTMATAVQSLVNAYGQNLLVLGYHPGVTDPYAPVAGSTAATQTTTRAATYGATAIPPVAVVNGLGADKIVGSGVLGNDLLKLNAQVSRCLATPAKFRIVGDYVLGNTPAPENRPVLKADVFVSRLDEEAPETESLTVRLVLAENVSGGPAWVVRDFLAAQSITLGYGQTQVLNVADFPLPPSTTWTLANCRVVAFLERADGTVVQGGILDRYGPGPNYTYSDELALIRPALVNQPPLAPAEVVVTQNAMGTELLATALGASDPDGDAIAYVFEWYLNGSLVASLHNQKVTLADYALATGQMWTCEVLVRDSYYASAPASMKPQHQSPAVLSNTMLLVAGQAPTVNQVPTVPTLVALSPDNPAAGEPVRCLVSGGTDPDADTFTYIFMWYKNGVPTAYTDAALPYGVTQVGEVWRCDVTARDVWGATSAAPVAASATILAPRAGAPTQPVYVVVGPDDPSYTSNLKCSEPTGVTCPGPYEVHYRWWKRTGALWLPTDITTPIVAMSAAELGSVWRCEVFARNVATGANGPSIISNAVLVRNYAPSAPSVAVSPQYAKVTDDLECFASGSLDKEDGSAIRYFYEWTLNGEFSGISGFGESKVTAAHLASGQVWTCSVYAVDQYGARSAVTASSNSAHVGGPPSAPTRAPVTPMRPEDDDDVVCAGYGAVDPDGDPILYLYDWYREEDLPAGMAAPTQLVVLPPNEGGRYWKLTFSGAVLSRALTQYGQRWCCVVRASDGVLVSAPIASEAVRIGNQPPTKPGVNVSPDLPRPGDALDCTITSAATDPEGDHLTYTFRWYRGAEATPAYIGPTLPAGSTHLGESWYCEVTVTDDWTPAASNGATTDAVLFRALPPTAPTQVYITPAFPKAGQDLVCFATGATDANGDPVHYEFHWYLNGTLQPALTTATVPAALTANLQQWRCEVRAVDNNELASAWVPGATVTVADLAPTQPGTVTVSPTPAGVLADLVCAASGSVDPNGDVVTYLFQWYDNGVLRPGFTDYRLPKANLERGHIWTCVVRANDGVLTSAPTLSNAVTIQNLPPTPPATVKISPAIPTVVNDLLCSASGATDPEGGPVSYTYSWSRNGSVTAFALQMVPAANLLVGDSWTCEIRAVDEEGAVSSAVASEAVHVVAASPSTPTAEVTPLDPSRRDDLTCTAGGSTDPLGGAVVYSFRWYRKHAGVWQDTGLTTSVVPGTGNLQTGDIWKCTVSAANSLGISSAVVTSNEVTIANHEPTPPVRAVVKPQTPVMGGTLTCYPSGATDRDGDPITYHFRWQNNGGVGGVWDDFGADSATATALGTDGLGYRCFVSASDGALATIEVMSNIVYVHGTAPAAPTSVSLNRVQGDLVCTAAGTANAGDVFVFTWFRNGVDAGLSGIGTLAGGVWTYTVSGVLTAQDQSWYCEVAVRNAFGAQGPVTRSATLTIHNSAPHQPADVTLRPAAPTLNNSLTCQVTAAAPADPDGDAVAYLFRWYKNGVEQTGVSGPLVLAALLRQGEVWYCEVIARDAYGAVSDPPRRSNEVVIGVAGNDAYEADNDASLAQTIVSGDRQVHAIPAGDVDWITFRVNALTEVRVVTNVQVGKASLEVALFREANLVTPMTAQPVEVSIVLKPGVYYARIRNTAASSGAPIYAVRLLTLPARALGTEDALYMTLSAASPSGWAAFYLPLPVGNTLQVTVAGVINRGTGSLAMTLYNETYATSYPETTPDSVRQTLGSGLYLLKVLGSGLPATGDISVRLTLTTAGSVPVTADLAPLAPTVVRLFPSQPIDLSPLHCVAYGARKPVGAAVVPLYYYFSWYQNGNLRPDLSGLKTAADSERVTTVPGAYVESGDTWRCEVTVRDGLDMASDAVSSNTVTVGDIADWSLTLTASGTANAVLKMGQAKAATDGWDAGVDQVAPGNGLPGVDQVYVITFEGPVVNPADPVQPYRFLCDDIRSFVGTSFTWFMQVANKDAQTLTWDSAAIPANVMLVLSEVDAAGGVIEGTDVDMKKVGRLDLSGASRSAPRYRILAQTGGSAYERIPLSYGWNLISFALQGDDDSLDNVFGGLNTGSVWKFDAVTKSYLTPTAIVPREAYWVLSTAPNTDPAVVEHVGAPDLVGNVPLVAGWNLVGPLVTCVVPDSAVILREAIWGFNPLTQAYAHPANGVLQVNRGYWIYAIQDVDLTLK